MKMWFSVATKVVKTVQNLN